MARQTRVYYDGALALDSEISLSEFASHHLMAVLRVTVGQKLVIFNGQGGEYDASVTALEKKHVRVLLQMYHNVNRESPLNIELVQGISRGERMEYAIQKAVELGVQAITPVFTERCGVKLSEERLARRLAHWHAIIIGACEQSGRDKLPCLNVPITLMDWLQSPEQSLRLVCSPLASCGMSTPVSQKISLLIGPEGGLSEAEITTAQQLGCEPIGLGPRILRTETAAVVAITLAQARFGDFISAEVLG